MAAPTSICCGAPRRRPARPRTVDTMTAGGPLQRLWTTAQVVVRTPGERRLPYLPIDQIRQRRDARVRALVQYAAAHVPYYRDLFKKLRLDARDVRGADDLDLLPVLEKRTLREHPLRFVAETARADDYLELVTSGTTGHPVPIRHDRRSLTDNLVHTEPEKEVVRSLVGRLSRRMMSITSPRSNATKITGFHRGASFIPTGAGQRRLTIDQPIDEIIGAIHVARPSVLMSYGSYLELLFRRAIARGIAVHAPRVVIYGADEMSAAGRQLIEERLGVKVLSRYGAIECLRIGFTCERSFGFHIREDICPLRLVDERGQPVPPGRPGQVVISNLVNHGTVLLNYRLGDVAVQSEPACACGRKLPVLAQINGRRDELAVSRRRPDPALAAGAAHLSRPARGPPEPGRAARTGPLRDPPGHCRPACVRAAAAGAPGGLARRAWAGPTGLRARRRIPQQRRDQVPVRSVSLRATRGRGRDLSSHGTAR